MEGLLRLSGVLTQEDPSTTDLSALEAQLARRRSSSQDHHGPSRDGSSVAGRGSSRHTPQQGDASRSPPEVEETKPKDPSATQATSQKTDKNDVESLADMMCSLMTNNFGETRFIGETTHSALLQPLTDQRLARARLPDFPSSRQRVSSG